MSKANKQGHNPFVGLSLEQVSVIESDAFMIQVGGEIYFHRDKCSFSVRNVMGFYLKILENLSIVYKNGNEQEKQDALYCMQQCRVLPLRIH